MAVKEVKLSTIEEVLTTLTTAEFNDALKRNRSAFLFRGLPNVSYKLTTSLRWNCKGKAGEMCIRDRVGRVLPRESAEPERRYR